MAKDKKSSNDFNKYLIIHECYGRNITTTTTTKKENGFDEVCFT